MQEIYHDNTMQETNDKWLPKFNSINQIGVKKEYNLKLPKLGSKPATFEFVIDLGFEKKQNMPKYKSK